MSTKATEENNKLAHVAILCLSDRAGFDHWWDNIDEETQDDILRELEKILRKAIRKGL